MGAYVGALYAIGLTPDEIAERRREELVRHRPFNDYTVPRVALIRARKAQRMLQRLFGARWIDELERDYFCVSADLVAAEPVVHRSGPLWEAVGASMSLPGLVPPVWRASGCWSTAACSTTSRSKSWRRGPKDRSS